MAGFVQVVGSNGSFSTVSSMAITPAHNTTKGNTLIGVFKTGTGQSVTSVTDSQSNTWTIDIKSAGSGPNTAIIRCYLAKALTTSDTITVNFGSNNGNSGIINEYAGRYGTLDDTAARTNGTSASSLTLTASSATKSAIELVVAAVGTGGNTNQTTFSITASTPSSMTVRSQGPSGFNVCSIADVISSATNTPSASWSWNTNATWSAALATYGLISGNNFFRMM